MKRARPALSPAGLLRNPRDHSPRNVTVLRVSSLRVVGLVTAGVRDRVACVSGDFFDSVRQLNCVAYAANLTVAGHGLVSSAYLAPTRWVPRLVGCNPWPKLSAMVVTWICDPRDRPLQLSQLDGSPSGQTSGDLIG
jgi:hypothetical protein